MIGGLVIAYALSPIDLIPDFIPVLGLLDDLILVPAGIALTIKLIPQAVIEDARSHVESSDTKHLQKWGLILVISAWCFILIFAAALWMRYRRQMS
jgi:uncharacterized membrane protein YkvA (DUF1232 family)